MTQNELKDWLPVVVGVITAAAALIGVAISALISYLNARSAMREQRQLRADERRIERLEELYVVFARWEMNFSQVYLINLRRHRGLLTPSQVHELVAKLDGLEKGDVHRLAMLLRLHFPELAKGHAAVQAARKAIVPFLDDSKPPNVAAFIAAQEQFEAVSEGFKLEIATVPRLSGSKVA